MCGGQTACDCGVAAERKFSDRAFVMASFWKSWQAYLYNGIQGPRPELSPWVPVRSSLVKRGITSCAWSDGRAQRHEEELVSMVHGAVLLFMWGGPGQHSHNHA